MSSPPSGSSAHKILELCSEQPFGRTGKNQGARATLCMIDMGFSVMYASFALFHNIPHWEYFILGGCGV